MLFYLLSMFTFAQEPAMSITVVDSPYEEIYMEEPRVICESACSWQQDTSDILVEVNRNHQSWLKNAEISAIYTDETIAYSGYECNFKQQPLKCSNQNGLWRLRTVINQDSEKATLNFLLYDERGVIIGQSNITKLKRTRVIERKKVSQQQAPQQPIQTTNCNQTTGTCTAIPIVPSPQTATETEDLEPIVIDIPPIITSRDLNQAVIFLYDSVRLR